MALNSQPQYQGRDGSRACPTSSAPTECCLRPTSAGSADTLVKPPNMLKVSLTKHICGPDTGQCMSACDHQVQLPGTFLLNCSRLEILKLVLYCPGCQEVVARVQLKLLLLEILFIFVWVEVWVRIGSLFKRRKKKKNTFRNWKNSPDAVSWEASGCQKTHIQVQLCHVSSVWPWASPFTCPRA